MRLLIALFSAFLFCALASRSEAQQQHFQLTYRAPDVCPNQAAFVDELSARLGYVPIDATASDAVRVAITQEGAQWAATVEAPDGSARVFRASACGELTRTVATALSVQLEPPAAPVAAPPPQVDEQRPSTVRVEVLSDVPGVTLHETMGMRTASVYASNGVSAFGVGFDFQRLCSAPCSLQLERREYRLALGETNVAIPLPVDTVTQIDGPSKLTLEYTSRAGLRLAGLITAIVGPAAGLAILLAGGFDSTTPLIVGSVVTGVTAGVGLVLMWQRDKVEVRLTPSGL